MGSPETQVPGNAPVPEPTPAELAAQQERKKLRIKGYITLLSDPNLNYRWRAAEALGDEGDETAVGPLLDALKDPFVDGPWLVAKSLGEMGGLRAVEPLIEGFKSDDKWLRVGAA